MALIIISWNQGFGGGDIVGAVQHGKSKRQEELMLYMEKKIAFQCSINFKFLNQIKRNSINNCGNFS
jgi:hypothetical protein